MKLSLKSEYACLALIELARNKKKHKLINTEQIASSQQIPRKFLEQILLHLKTAGYIRSKRGVNGGHQLAKAPQEICLAEIIRLMDGALAPVESVSKYFYSETPIEKSKKLLKVFKDIRNYVSDKLENTTLADLI